MYGRYEIALGKEPPHWEPPKPLSFMGSTHVEDHWSLPVDTTENIVAELNRQVAGVKDKHDIFFEHVYAEIRERTRPDSKWHFIASGLMKAPSKNSSPVS